MLQRSRNNQPKMFFIGKIASFWEIVFIDHVGPSEIISKLEQEMWRYISDPYKLFLEVCFTR